MASSPKAFSFAEMVELPGGTFQMGSDRHYPEEAPAHRVTVCTFRIDRTRSRLTLTRPDHTQSVLKISPDGAPNVIATTARLDTPGDYSVRWQVLAADGHITRGEIPFRVK